MYQVSPLQVSENKARGKNSTLHPHFFSPFLQQVKYLEIFANTLAFSCLTQINSTQGQHFQTLLCLAVALKSYANLAKLGSHKNHFVQLMINKSLENHPFIQSMLLSMPTAIMLIQVSSISLQFLFTVILPGLKLGTQEGASIF